MKLTIVFLAILVLATLSPGCNGHHDSMMSTNGSISDAILNIYPAEGATGVSVFSSVAVKFNRIMDTSSIMNNLQLMGGKDMNDWMDTVAEHGGMEHMPMRDREDMMNWMDSTAIPGTFSWNEAMDSCEFTPDTQMSANLEHMIFMDIGSMMDHSGGMMGSNNANDRYLSHHFTTGQ